VGHGPSASFTEGFESALSAETVLAELAAGESSAPLILDLDETLLLTNSTEEYLDSLRPRVVGHALLLLLGVVRPWMLWSENSRNDARDVIRVAAATILLPWSRVLWFRRARILGRDHMNPRLMDVVAERPGTTVVATNGFRFIVAPILDAAGLGDSPLISVRLSRGFRDRAHGKHRLTIDALGESVVERATIVTDSELDRDLIDLAHRGFVVKWPEASYVKAMSRHYMPLVYLDQVKHPRQQFFLKTVIADDWLISVLALAWIAQEPARAAAGMLFLMLAWWTVYEIGYRRERSHWRAVRE
jgi:phosphoserine phosphatase